MASLTCWTWIWANSRSWWWTGKPNVLQSMESQRVRQGWTTELNWKYSASNYSLQIQQLGQSLLPSWVLHEIKADIGNSLLWFSWKNNSIQDLSHRRAKSTVLASFNVSLKEQLHIFLWNEVWTDQDEPYSSYDFTDSLMRICTREHRLIFNKYDI